MYMSWKRPFIGLTAMALLSTTTLGQGQPQPAPKGKEPFAVDLQAITSLSEGGRAEAVLLRLEAIAENLKSPNVSAVKRCIIMQQALRIAVSSKVGKNDAVRAAAAKFALTTISETRGKGTASSELLEQQLGLALEILPWTSATPERIAEVSLQVWADLLAATKDLSAYDPSHPGVKLEIPDPPPNSHEDFTFGQSPEGIKDPVFRKQYSDYLRDRGEFGRNACKLWSLRAVPLHFLPELKAVLRSAYSADREKVRAGSAAIEKYVRDPLVRRELLDAIQPR